MTETKATSGPIVIVFGNEKGGTGKSTLAMHVAAALMARGATVATIDLDAAQGTLTRYLHHRREFARRTGRALPMPTHSPILPAPHQGADEAEMVKAIAAAADSDAIIIDTPGHASELSLAGHSYADIIVTPMNDSLIDLDVLARVDPEKLRVQSPSHYAERIWKAKQQRARRDGGSIDWVVVRNRVGALDARNKRRVAGLIGELSKRIGCRVADGIGERVIFRELFLDGLTVEDLSPETDKARMAISHVAARAEIRTLLGVLGLDDRAWKPRKDALS
jgi:chromosome partitioning protein